MLCENQKMYAPRSLADTIVEAFRAKKFARSDGVPAPFCITALLLQRIGFRSHVRLLIDTAPSVQRYTEELDAYEGWFSTAMASVSSPWAVRTKHGIKQRVRLRRDDVVQPRRHQTVAIGPEWIQTKRNQLQSVVANGLVASFELKRFLVQQLGPGATSSGSTGLERGWWHRIMFNANPCATWATPAYRQYRAVVVWKSEVAAAIRKLRCGFGTAKYTQIMKLSP